MNWIKVSDELPKFDTYVLTTDGRDIRISVYQDMSDIDSCNRWHSEFWEVNVTHWMSLPELPKGNKE